MSKNPNETIKERLLADDPDYRQQGVAAIETFVRTFIEDKPYYKQNIPSTNIDDKCNTEPAVVVDGWFPVYLHDFNPHRDCREVFVDRIRRLVIRHERDKRRDHWEANWDGKPHHLKRLIEKLTPFYQNEIYSMIHKSLMERGPGGIKFDYRPGLPEDIGDIFDQVGDGYEQYT